MVDITGTLSIENWTFELTKQLNFINMDNTGIILLYDWVMLFKF